MVQLLALSMIYLLAYLIPTYLIFIFGHSGNMLVHLLLCEQFCYVFSQSHTYYFCMYSVKNDECPYDKSHVVGCVINLGDLKYLTRYTFRIDSLVSGIFHIFQALTGCFYAFFYHFYNPQIEFSWSK